MTMKLQVVLPELRLTGQYKFGGKIFALVCFKIGKIQVVIRTQEFNPILFIDNVTLDFYQPLVV